MVDMAASTDGRCPRPRVGGARRSVGRPEALLIDGGGVVEAEGGRLWLWLWSQWPMGGLSYSLI
jgi:hypothetical protein